MLITPLLLYIHLTSKCLFPPFLEPVRKLQLDELTTVRHTKKPPNHWGGGEHWGKTQIRLSVFIILSVQEGSFHPNQTLQTPARGCDRRCLSTAASSPEAQPDSRRHQRILQKWKAGRESQSTCYSAWDLATKQSLRLLEESDVQEILKGPFQTQLIQVQVQTSFCLPFRLPEPFTASPPCLSEDFRRTEKETIKFWSEELFKY